MARGLFINSKELKRFTQLNGNVDSDRFLDAVWDRQNRDIQSILGTDLYNKIKGHIEAGNLSSQTAYKNLLDDYIKPVLINYAMAELVNRLHFQLSNKGIFVHTSENAIPATTDDVIKMEQRYSSIAEYYAQRLTDYLSFNSNNFPEYTSNTDTDLSPDRRGYFTNIILD